MIKSYGLLGGSQETRTDIDLKNPYILMKSDRPAPHYVATESGEWIAPEDTREYKHFDVRDFFKLFTPERVAIKTATTADVHIGIWYDDALSAKYITYSDPDTVAGMQYLVDANLLTQERHDEIVAILVAEKEM